MDAARSRSREASSGGLELEPATVLPIKLYSRLAPDASVIPEKRLLLAVLEEAVRIADAHNDEELGFDARQQLIQAATFGGAPDVSLVALAYRPVHRSDQDQIDTWAVPLELGGTLPVLPLSLRGAEVVPLDLEATYTETRQRCRL